MREWPYAKEPFDFKLYVLLFLKKIWIVVCAMLVGALLVGSAHYLHKAVFGGPTEYEITTTYYVEYNMFIDETGEIYGHTNMATWESWVTTDWFVDRAWEHALETGFAPENFGVEKSDLKEFFSATLPSDVRIPTSTVKTPSQELTKVLNAALQQTFADFGITQQEMDEIRVIDETPITISDKNVRLLRACILGALLGLFAAAFCISVKIIWDGAIIIPDTFTYRYGLPMTGFAGKEDENLNKETQANLGYLFKDRKKNIVVGIGQGIRVEKLLSLLAPMGFAETVKAEDLGEKNYEKLRNADGILLAVEAGTHNDKEIEHVLHELQLQNCMAQGALLCNADVKLIKAYRFGRGRK